MSARSQISLHKLGSNSPVHTDAGSAAGGPTYFWHLLLLTLPEAATTIMLAVILCAELLFERGFPPSSQLEMAVQLPVK